MARRQSSCEQGQQRRHHVMGGMMGRRWRTFGAAVVAIGGCCVASVGMLLAHAALPKAVKDCKFADKSTAAKPCTADLYMGEYMKFQCGAKHTAEPTEAQTKGKYCASPVTDSGSCGSVKTLEADVGTTTQDGDRVVLRLKEDYSDKFGGKITYHVRCVDGANKVFVKVGLWPFTRPLSEKPKKSCVNEDDVDTSADVRCNFFSFKSDKATVDCREDSHTGTFVPADAITENTGKVCSTGFKANTAEPECLAEDTWANVAAGTKVAKSNSDPTIEVDSKALTNDRGVVYIGCTRDGGGGKKMYTKGMLLKNDFVAIDKKYVPMIKHICNPSNGKAVAQPCEAQLEADEAAVVVCANYASNKKYKLMPPDVNQADGNYCTAMPSSFNEECKDKAKWKESAKAEVMMDATMDFFIVAMPTANAGELKKTVTTYGYCSDEKNGVAFKISMGKSSGSTKKPDDDSAAVSMTFGGAVMGLVTFLSAAMVAVAVF